MDANGLLCADPAIVRLHADAAEHAVKVNAAIAAARGGISLTPLAGGALHAIGADVLAMHRSTLCLCDGGWAFVAPVVLRPMLDLLLSTAVITEDPEQAEYRGFKYTHSFHKAMMRKTTTGPVDRERLSQQVRQAIALLPAASREKARRFVYQERAWPYWYCPEYDRPRKVIEKFSGPEIASLYDTLSAGSHGGFVGLRIFKDEPDEIHPNPRSDSFSQHLVLGGSTKMLLDTMHIRDTFENGAAHRGDCEALTRRLASLRPLLRVDS
jgi:hypothetical protein